MNIDMYEEEIKNKLFSISYATLKNDFLSFNIYASWLSKYISSSNSSRLRYRRFLQLIGISPNLLNNLCDNKKFKQLCKSNENITKIIQITKNILKEEFKKRELKKTEFLLELKDDENIEIEISSKTLTRFFNYKSYTEFSLRTFLIIMEGMKMDYNYFFNKIVEVMNNEINN